MKKTKTILLFIFLLILVTSITHAALLTKYASITGHVTILPEDPTTNTPPDKDACKDEGYLNYVKLNGEPFTEQGDCISYITTHMCEDWEILNTIHDDLNATKYGECVSYFNSQKNKDEPQMQIMNTKQKGSKNNQTNTTSNLSSLNTTSSNENDTSNNQIQTYDELTPETSNNESDDTNITTKSPNNETTSENETEFDDNEDDTNTTTETNINEISQNTNEENNTQDNNETDKEEMITQ